jgi:two-component system NarL family sensor kinase
MRICFATRWGIGLLGLLLGGGRQPSLAQTPAPADTIRINKLLAAAQRTAPDDTARHRRYLEQALALSQAAGYDFGRGVSYNALAYLAGLRGDTTRNTRYLQRARQALEPLYRRRPERRVGLTLASITNNEANNLQRRGNYPAAAQAMLRTASYLHEAGNFPVLVTIYYNLGGIFFSLDQPDKALTYWQQALELQPKAPEVPVLVVVAANVAAYYTEHGRPDLARRYLAQARAWSAQGPGAYFRDQYFNAQGKYELNQGRRRQGVALLDKALALARRRGDASVLSALLPDVAEGHKQLGEYEKARGYLLEGMRLTREAGDVDLTVELEDLANLEEKLGHPAQALAYYRRRTALYDSLNSVAVKNQINALETVYQTRQQAQRIQLLQQDQRLQAAELRRQRTLTLGTLALAAALAGAGALGYVALRSRRKLEHQQQQLQAQKIQELEQERQLTATEAMLRGQEEERGRLARDLHDGLGGMLSSVKYYLGSVRGAVVLPEASAQLFARSLDQLDSSISELRRVARDMMPEALLQFGLVPALRDVCEAMSLREQFQVRFQAYGLDERLPQRTEVVVYRLVQELLNNVLKHAQAHQVIVQLVRDGQQVQIVVEDDGQGFDAHASRSGVGLRSVQARVDYLRGTLDLHTAPGQGTTFTIEFTLPEES